MDVHESIFLAVGKTVSFHIGGKLSGIHWNCRFALLVLLPRDGGLLAPLSRIVEDEDTIYNVHLHVMVTKKMSAAHIRCVTCLRTDILFYSCLCAPEQEWTMCRKELWEILKKIVRGGLWILIVIGQTWLPFDIILSNRKKPSASIKRPLQYSFEYGIGDSLNQRDHGGINRVFDGNHPFNSL